MKLVNCSFYFEFEFYNYKGKELWFDYDFSYKNNFEILTFGWEQIKTYI